MTWMHRLSNYFLYPELLAAAAIAGALVLVVLLWLSARKTRHVESLVTPSIAAKTGQMLRSPGNWVSLALVFLLTVGLLAALARPRWGTIPENVKREGTDIVIVIDTSASMNAVDVSPSRFVLARMAAASLLPRLSQDRVALVACEGDAQILVPLTLDTAAVGLFLEALEPGVGTLPGTSLAAGLKTVAGIFSGLPPGARQCVVISDGEDLEGGVDEAVALAKKDGIIVHTVFSGPRIPKGAPVPNIDVAGRMLGYKTDTEGKTVLSRPDPDLLRKLAAETGGSFSVVSPGKTGLSGLSAEIEKAARRPLDETTLANRIERYQIPLGIAVLALGALLIGVPPFRIPWRRKATATVLFLFLTALPARGQTPPEKSSGPPPEAAAPAAAPAPAPQSLWQRILSKPPFKTARGEAQKGVAALEKQQPDEAIGHFQKQKDLAPENPLGAYNLGTAYSAAGKAGEEALANLQQARNSGKRDVANLAAYNQGNILFKAGKYDEAAQAYRESLKLSPGASDASWNYELSLLKAAEEKKKQQEQEKKQQQQQKKEQPTPTPTPTPQSKQDKEKQKKEEEEKQFQQKAGMTKDKADQLLSAIANADREEQKRQMAERRKEKRVARDW